MKHGYAENDVLQLSFLKAYIVFSYNLFHCYEQYMDYLTVEDVELTESSDSIQSLRCISLADFAQQRSHFQTNRLNG